MVAAGMPSARIRSVESVSSDRVISVHLSGMALNNY